MAKSKALQDLEQILNANLEKWQLEHPGIVVLLGYEEPKFYEGFIEAQNYVEEHKEKGKPYIIKRL